MVRSSFVIAASLVIPSRSRRRFDGLGHLRLRPFLHFRQLMPPEPLEFPGPFVQRTPPRRVRPVKLTPPVPPHPHQTHIPQHAQVLRYRRLLQRQRHHDRRHRLLPVRQEHQDCAPSRLRHRIERVRSCRRPCHAQTIHSHMGICQEKPFRSTNPSNRHHVYIHLIYHDRNNAPRSAVPVRHASPLRTRAHPTLRGVPAPARIALKPVHDPASSLARRGNIGGPSGRCPGHGQHEPHAHARGHAPPSLDRRAPRRRSPRTPAPPGQIRRSASESRATALAADARPPARRTWRRNMAKPFPNHESVNRNSRHAARRFKMKNYAKLVLGLISGWFILSLTLSAFHVFLNPADRVGISVAIAAVGPIVVFSVWRAASPDFRRFTLSLNSRVLAFLQTGRVLGVVFLILAARGVL